MTLPRTRIDPALAARAVIGAAPALVRTAAAIGAQAVGTVAPARHPGRSHPDRSASAKRYGTGDVFGNGMLLPPSLHAASAFDHRDLVLDLLRRGMVPAA